MTGSKEESKAISNSKRVPSSKVVVFGSANSKNNSKLKEGILLITLSLVIMVSAYLVYNGGFGLGDSSLLKDTNGDGICQSTENCLDQGEDCACNNGEYCSTSDKRCVAVELLPAPEDDELLPAGDLLPPVDGEVLPPAEIIIENCTYDKSKDLISCTTNCQSDSGGNTVISVMDANLSMAIARESEASLQMGTLSFEGEKVVFKASHVEFAGSVISLSFSELMSDTNKWRVSLSCKNPVGTATTIGVVRQ